MGGLLWGLADLALGLAFVLAGLRMFLTILPMGAFLVGWYVTGIAFHHLGNEAGLLESAVSIIVGLTVGVCLALISYVLWYVGLLVLVAATGATVGSAILAVFSAEAGLLLLVVALFGAAVALFIAYEFYVPTWIVIVGTSMFGAVAIVIGTMLVLDRIEIDDLQNGPALAVVNQSWLWVLAWAGVAAIGIWVQYMTARDTELPEGRWTFLQPEAYARVGRRSRERRHRRSSHR
jgi:hypothetical protein